MIDSPTLSRPFEGASRFARKLWRAYPRETVGFGVLGLVVAGALAGAAHSTPELPSDGARAAAPVPPPLLLRQVAPEQAVTINQDIPIANGPNPAARPFEIRGNAATRSQALQCLTSAVYYEAGSQSDDGERAVAQVVLNRVRHPAFPASVCGVVYQGSTRATGCQFTFTCDGSLNRQPDAEGWERARRIADAALNGYVFAPVGYATHYHADYVVPYWASTLAKNAIVGAHIFYRWAGGWGRPAAFVKTYAGSEPNASALRSAALAAVHIAPNGPASVAEAIRDIPGAEALPLTPSMRGDKRVAVRFNVAARKAADAAPHKPYVESVQASDTLRWSLSGDSVGSSEKPLGKTASAGSGSAPAASQP